MKVLLLVFSAFFSVTALADHVIPALEKIYNLRRGNDHILALEGELSRIQSFGYQVHGVGGIVDGGHIGCVPRYTDGTNNSKYLIRKRGDDGNHIVLTQYEIENNIGYVNDRFRHYAAHAGYLLHEPKFPGMVKLVRAYNPQLNDHMVFGLGSGIYSDELTRVASHGFTDLTKRLGYMFHRDYCD